MYRYRTGSPYTRLLVVEDITQETFPQGTFTVRAERRGSSLTDSVHSLDLRFDQTFDTSFGTFGIILDLFNFFNGGAVVDKAAITSVDYGDPEAYQRPRVARIGMRFIF